MGLMKKAYDTYCALENKYVGEYSDEYRVPLVPVGHQIVKADIIITLDADGELQGASAMGKENADIIIPVTEASAGRSGTNLTAHPLCDQIRFLTPKYKNKYKSYMTQIRAWEKSEYSHPKVSAIANYVEKGTILEDLEEHGLVELNGDGLPKDEKLMVCWKVETGDENETPECWKDKTLFQAFIDYHAASQKREIGFCMVTGENAPLAIQHPKKIITINNKANAKLISSNDTSGFTYRGRFTDDKQAATISYDASQKAHNVIKWLIANQGVYAGYRVFLCWNPHGAALPKIDAPLMQTSDEIHTDYSDYRKALYETLYGWKERMPSDSEAVVAALEAATNGRVSLVYYSEFGVSDFLERLRNWDENCCWLNGRFGIQSPSLYQIVNYAFGTLKSSNDKQSFETSEEIMQQHTQRLISCRIDNWKMPIDIARAVTETASNLKIISDDILREKVLFTACAVLRKYYHDRNQEDFEMALEPDKKDISYQYGRLLAVFEKLERDTYDEGERREPTAIRLQTVFAKRPMHYTQIISQHLKKAYYRKIKPSHRVFYEMLIEDILSKISECPGSEREKPLNGSYLFGYYLQKSELYRSKNKETNQEEELCAS